MPSFHSQVHPSARGRSPPRGSQTQQARHPPTHASARSRSSRPRQYDGSSDCEGHNSARHDTNRSNRHHDDQNTSGEDDDENDDDEDLLYTGREHTLVSDLTKFAPSARRPRSLHAIHFDAKYVGREVHMDINVGEVLAHGPKLRAAFEAHEDHEASGDYEQLSEDDRTLLLSQFRHMLRVVRCLEDDLKTIGSNKRALAGLTKLITCAIAQARREDCKKLRRACISWLPAMLTPARLGTNCPSALDATKAGRGFSHISTGRLLVAADDLAIFDANPIEYCESVNNAQRELDAGDFPAFLYPEDGYDPDEKDKGALEGALCPMAYAAIWAGAQAAEDSASSSSRRKGRQPVGKGHEAITPAKVAYSLVLLRFSLSTQEEWAETHGSYNNLELYDTFLSLFTGDDDWTKNALTKLELRVWKRVISGEQRGTKRTARDMLAEQREARRSRVASQ